MNYQKKDKGEVLLESDFGDSDLILTQKITTYAKKFKGFDPRIIQGCKLCYKHSPLYRRHINSKEFGKTMGWRLTHAWTQQPKFYDNLTMIGPLDLGLFSVRIDAILGNNQLLDFVKQAKHLPIFRSYIHATQNFILNLLANNDCSWLDHHKKPAYEKLIALCKNFSPTFNEVLQNGKGDGWELVNVWSDTPDNISALREIFPLDIAAYCIRLDSIIYNTDLTEFAKEINKHQYFSILPMEVMKFICQIKNQWGVE